MKRFKTTVVAAALFALPTAGLALEEPGPLSLTPYVGGYTMDGAEDIDTGIVTGLRLEYDFTKHLGVELTGEYLPTETEAGMDVDFYRYSIGLIYNMLPDARINPYISAGFGGRTINPDVGSNVTKGIADAGAGIKYRIPNSVASVRLDLRYLAQVSDVVRPNLQLTDYHPNFEYTLGLVLPLSTAAAPAAPADSDNDGVIDALDKCPGTAAGVKVDASGCPVPVAAAVAPVVAAAAAPLDSDKDGVVDALDKCPNTAAGVKVDANGCPLDSDQDGVVDSADKCPGTAVGVKVDAVGCPLDSDQDGVIDSEDQCPNTRAGLAVDRKGCPPPIEENVKINLNVLFASGKTVIQDQYTAEINKLGDFMNTYPGTTTTIEGHTDNVGSAALNKKLSQQRADAVRTYMINKYGIAPERIKAIGYGPDRPVADNKTAEGRQQNRRIEAAVETTVVKPQK